MNKLLLGAAAIVATVAAVPAHADTVGGEVIFRNFGHGTNVQEYDASYTNQGHILRTGVDAAYLTGDKPDQFRLGGNVGVDLQAPAGVRISPTVGAGWNFNNGGADGSYWTAGVVAERDFGPLTASVGYRHRAAFRDNTSASFALDENRLNAGLRLNVNEHLSAGVNYYKSDAKTDSDAVGFSLRATL